MPECLRTSKLCSALLPMVIAALVMVGPVDGHAQALTVTGIRDLQFQTVIAGIPTSVPRTNRQQAGFFRIRGARNAEVLIQFTLPTGLSSPGQVDMPCSFGPADGGYGTSPQVPSMVAFDPNSNLVTRLASNNGRLYIALGGTVSPPFTQTPGTYAATLTMTVTYTGN
jgi:hypothetical protein